MSERWQYKVHEVKTGVLGGMKVASVESELQAFGQQGWELVNALQLAGRPLILFLKRRA